ncbi:TPA: pyridoxal phosphate-dependent aminotransferase [Candidatus Poribacteria bacterium]|nr:pyridoxal phosphate-dependent aminotransferase [Candidatus Poribacteria bacterium]
MKLAKRMSRLGTESAFNVLAKAKALEAQGKDIIHLEIGQPDFKTPDHICEAAFKAMQEGYTGYGPAAGMLEFREVIADYISETRNIEVDPDEISVTPGAKPIIFFSILACVDEGDEAIYPDPGFPIYESVIDFVGAKAVPLPLLEEVDFRFRIEDLERIISDKTKYMIINSPQNPTGGVLTRSDLEAIAELAIKHDVIVVSDEVYCKILYEGKHESIINIPGMKERTILIDGHSKTYAMTGWRLGYGVMPKPLAEAVNQLMINSNSCTCTFTQMAGLAALTGPQDSVAEMVAEFKRRRDTIVDGLNAIEGISCKKPLGSFYVFPNVQKINMHCDELSDYIMEEAGVAVLPGTAFGRYGEGYLRLSYANSLENIKEALARIKKAVEKIA